MSSLTSDYRAHEFLPPIFGSAVVGMVWALDLTFRGLPWTPTGLMQLHAVNPVLIFLDIMPLGLLGLTWLLALQRRTKNRLFATEDRFERTRHSLDTRAQQLLSGVFDGLLLVDSDGKLIQCNHAAELQFGFKSDELRGKSIGELLLGLDIVGEGVRQPRRTWRREVLAVEKHIQGRHKSGLRFPVATTEAPLLIQGTEGTLYTIRDLGDQISHAETQLRIEVDPEALLPKEEVLAPRARDARNRASLQRMRAPLASLLGQAADVREGLDAQPDVQEALTRIEGVGHTLLVQLANMTDLDRIESDDLELHVETVPVDAVALSAVDAVRSITRGSGNWIEAELPGNDATCEVDQRAARDVLINLMLNASQNTTGRRITLRARREQKGALYDVVFEVEDPGKGMTGPELERLLYESDPASPAIGLRVARALADSMGGELSLKSAPGEGTTATLRVQSRDKPTLVPARSRRWAPPVKEKERKERVALVVGASPVELGLIRDALEDLRWQVNDVHVGQAIEVITEQRPDLVVLGFEQPQKTWQIWLAMKRHPILGLFPTMCVDNGAHARRAWTTRLASSPPEPDAIGAMAGHLRASRIVPRAMLIERRDFERNTLASLLRSAGWWVYSPENAESALELSAELPPELLVLGGDLGDDANLGQLLAVVRGVPATRDLPVILLPGRALTDDEQTRAERARATVIGPDEPTDLLVVHATLALSAPADEA